MYALWAIVYLTLNKTSAWASLLDKLDTAVDDPNILLDWYQLPANGCPALVYGSVQGTVCIVSDGSFNPDSSLGPTSTSTVFGVLQKAKHKIKTGYGVSAPVYGNEESTISGIGQGNGLWPALWALVSSVIIKMCKAKGYGMKVTTPISKEDLSILGFAFVDDADIVLSANDVHTTGATMITRF